MWGWWNGRAHSLVPFSFLVVSFLPPSIVCCNNHGILFSPLSPTKKAFQFLLKTWYSDGLLETLDDKIHQFCIKRHMASFMHWSVLVLQHLGLLCTFYKPTSFTCLQQANLWFRHNSSFCCLLHALHRANAIFEVLLLMLITNTDSYSSSMTNVNTDSSSHNAIANFVEFFLTFLPLIC